MIGLPGTGFSHWNFQLLEFTVQAPGEIRPPEIRLPVGSAYRIRLRAGLDGCAEPRSILPIGSIATNKTPAPIGGCDILCTSSPEWDWPRRSRKTWV